MRQFHRYPKIYRLGLDEVDGILEGKCYIQEKLDGANTSIYLRDGKIICASRNMEKESGFNGFVDYVNSHEGIKRFFHDHPNERLYGEWLVKHTITYKATAHNKFYLFDIMTEAGDFISPPVVETIAIEYEMDYPKIMNVIENPTIEGLKPHIGISMLGDVGEGIVIKNPTFINKFGYMSYAKIVTEKFKEDNAATFGGNNKHAEAYWEMWIADKYMTLARVKKAEDAILNSEGGMYMLGLEDTPRVISTAYHDLLTEEIWAIQKKVPAVSFKTLSRICMKKARVIFHDMLNDNFGYDRREDDLSEVR